MMLLGKCGRILLVRAREMLVEGKEQFICVALEIAKHGYSAEYWEAVRDLKDSIEVAIEKLGTVESYLYAKYGLRPERLKIGEDHWDRMHTFASEIVYFPTKEFYNLALECRLAWIDRMLETYEVK